MKTKNNLGLLLLLAPLAFVVMVSGCTNLTGSSSGVTFGNGVQITGWEPDFTSVESGEPVTLQLKLQNTGRVDAENVKAQIINIDLNEWGTGTGWSGDEKDIGTLIAPDEATSTPGQTETTSWNVEAPELPAGMEFTYEPIVRVSYDYQTRAAKPVTLVTTEELRRIVQQGKTLPGESTTSTEGPLSVEIKTGNFVKTKDVDQEFPIYILITNDLWESGGSVIPSSGNWGGGWGSWGSDDERYPVEMTVNLPEGLTLTSDGSDSCSTSGETVELWKGKSAEITCMVRAESPDVRTERLIQVELEYSFYIDSSTSITVKGTSDSSSGWW